MAGDESTDTGLLVIFIRAATFGLDVAEEFLDMVNLSSKTTEQDNRQHVITVVEKFELNPAKFFSITTNAAPSMTFYLILSKLHYYGIRNHTLSWIGAFLSNRTQTTVVNGVHTSYVQSINQSSLFPNQHVQK